MCQICYRNEMNEIMLFFLKKKNNGDITLRLAIQKELKSNNVNIILKIQEDVNQINSRNLNYMKRWYWCLSTCLWRGKWKEKDEENKTEIFTIKLKL